MDALFRRILFVTTEICSVQYIKQVKKHLSLKGCQPHIVVLSIRNRLFNALNILPDAVI